MDTGTVIGSMIMCILMGSCAILTEVLDFMPENISDFRLCAFLIAWGVFIASAFGVAASGIL